MRTCLAGSLACVRRATPPTLPPFTLWRAWAAVPRLGRVRLSSGPPSPSRLAWPALVLSSAPALPLSLSTPLALTERMRRLAAAAACEGGCGCGRACSREAVPRPCLLLLLLLLHNHKQAAGPDLGAVSLSRRGSRIHARTRHRHTRASLPLLGHTKGGLAALAGQRPRPTWRDAWCVCVCGALCWAGWCCLTRMCAQRLPAHARTHARASERASERNFIGAHREKETHTQTHTSTSLARAREARET